MNQTNTSYFFMGLSIGLIILFICSFLEPNSRDNMGDYLRYQDDKIASQSAEIILWKERTENWLDKYEEEYETRVEMEEFLTTEQSDIVWSYWASEICPRHEQPYDGYCNY